MSPAQASSAQAVGAPALETVTPARSSWLGFGRLLRAEWTKIRSVQSTLWSLLAFVVVAIGFSTLVASVISHDWNTPGNHPNHLRLVTDPTAVIFGAGLGLGQLAICVLGAIVMTSEYTTGTIRASLLAVPTRIPMLSAKALVFAIIDFVVSAVTVFAVFFITTAILRSHVSITLGQPGVTRALIGAILYLTVLGLFAGAPSAFAFTTQSSASIDTMTSARVADPEDLMENMASQQSGAGPATVLHLGGSNLTVGGSSSSSETGANSRFLVSPAAATVPSQQGQ